MYVYVTCVSVRCVPPRQSWFLECVGMCVCRRLGLGLGLVVLDVAAPNCWFDAPAAWALHQVVCVYVC